MAMLFYKHFDLAAFLTAKSVLNWKSRGAADRAVYDCRLWCGRSGVTLLVLSRFDAGYPP